MEKSVGQSVECWLQCSERYRRKCRVEGRAEGEV